MNIDQSTILALLGGVGIAILVGPLGCFAVWRRMAYFGDSLAHSGLLGIAMGMIFGINQHVAILITCCLFAVLLVWLQTKKFLATDTLLGILAHGGLSLGMIVLGIIGGNKHAGDEDSHLDIHSFLFGDIMTIKELDIVWIGVSIIIVLSLLIYFWQDLILMVIGEDCAKAEGVNIFMLNIMLMLLMAVVVAVSINIVGMLLITSTLIIPAASSRQFAKNPESMAIYAVIIAAISVVVGIFLHLKFALETSPAIVVTEIGVFLLLLILSIATGSKRHFS